MQNKSNLPARLSALFLVLSLWNLYFEWMEQQVGIYCTKPLLMVTLALFFARSVKQHSRTRGLVLIAILFSVAGDTLLMFTEQEAGGPIFFLLGLAAFLVTHVFYSLAFLSIRKLPAGQLQKQPLLGIPYLIFFAFFLSWIWKGIPSDMLIPVVLYSLAILCMQLTALNLGRKAVGQQTYLLLVFGALLFMASDSLIAVNRFMGEVVQIGYVRIWIMSLYLLGQWMIALGASRYLNNER